MTSATPPSAGRIAMIDGVLVAPDAAVVSVYDRGFLYGDSVFEVVRAYDGAPFALAEHLARLEASAAVVLLALPLSRDALAREIHTAIAAARASDDQPRDHSVRVVLTRGSGPLGLAIESAVAPRRVVLVEPVVPPPPATYEAGIAVVSVVTTRAVEGTAAAAAKYGSYLANALALHEARTRGAADALLVDAAGRVFEAATSNVFIVRAGRVSTPPIRAGILAGITRATVLTLARAVRLHVDDARELFLADVANADECFLTSSIREVAPVVTVDGKTIGRGVPGPITGALHRALRRAAGARDSVVTSPR